MVEFVGTQGLHISSQSGPYYNPQTTTFLPWKVVGKPEKSVNRCMLLARFRLPPWCKDALLSQKPYCPFNVISTCRGMPRSWGQMVPRFICIFRAMAFSWLPLAKRPWSVFRCLLTAFPCLCSFHGSSMDDWRDRNRQGLCLRQYRQQTETNRLTWERRLQKEPWELLAPA